MPALTAEQLLENLATCSTDAERAALLSRLDADQLEGLHALLFYQRFTEECAAESARLTAFDRELAAAANDDERARIVTAAQADPSRGRKFLAEWLRCHQWLARFDTEPDLYERTMAGEIPL